MAARIDTGRARVAGARRGLRERPRAHVCAVARQEGHAVDARQAGGPLTWRPDMRRKASKSKKDDFGQELPAGRSAPRLGSRSKQSALCYCQPGQRIASLVLRPRLLRVVRVRASSSGTSPGRSRHTSANPHSLRLLWLGCGSTRLVRASHCGARKRLAETPREVSPTAIYRRLALRFEMATYAKTLESRR